MALGGSAAALEDLDAYLDAGAPEGDADDVRARRDRLLASTRRKLS
jgi:hypothetical protein